MFDYVIVGGGSAGCVLAGRLSEDPAVKVCLLEAGPPDTSILIKVPAGLAVLAKNQQANWSLNTVPQPGLNGRRGYQPRGKVMGGSSSINAMVYTRGNRQDGLAGEVHAANALSPTITPDLVAETGSRIFTSIAPRYSALFFNLSETGAAGLKSREVRQAIAYGLDRAALVDQVLNGQGVEFEGPYLPDNWAARPDVMTTFTHQPDTAGSLLDTAGWTGAGTRIREGIPLLFRLVTIDRPEQRAVAEEIAGQLSRIGMEAQLTLLPDVDSFRQTLAERNYDCLLYTSPSPRD